MKKQGFTLVEVMLVAGIISMLAALAIPNIMRARLNANESTAVSAIRSIATSCNGYRAVNPVYPSTLSVLSNCNPPYIDVVLATGAKQGYNFVLTGTTYTYTATARPQIFDRTGIRSFFIDETGVLRYTLQDAEATVSDNPIE